MVTMVTGLERPLAISPSFLHGSSNDRMVTIETMGPLRSTEALAGEIYSTPGEQSTLGTEGSTVAKLEKKTEV